MGGRNSWRTKLRHPGARRNHGIPEGPGPAWAELLGQFSRPRGLGRPARAERFSLRQLPGFNERLMAWLPTMIEHRCSVGERGGFFERLRRGTYQGTSSSMSRSNCKPWPASDVGFGRARETSEDGVYKVVIEYEEEELGRAVPGNRPPAAATPPSTTCPFDVTGRSCQTARPGPAGLPGSQHRAPSSKPPRKRGIPVRRLNYRQPGAARLRRAPAPHSGRRDRPHRRHRRSRSPRTKS